MARSFGDTLRPFQRRLRLIGFVRYAPSASVAALGAVGVALVVFRPSALLAALACAAALAVALTTALGIALRRTPSLAETARTVDACFRLDDRVATALQFSETRDPVSRLVVAEATARLEATSPSSLPLDVYTPLRRTALAAFAIVTVVGIALVGRWSSPSSSSGMEAATSDAGPGQGSAAARAARPADAADASRGGQTVQVSPSSFPESGRQASPGSAQTAVRPEGRRSAADGPAQDSGGSARSAGSEGRAPGRAPSTPQPSSSSAPGSGRAENGEATGPGAGRALSGTGRGGGEATAEGGAAGGIAGGALVALTDNTVSGSAAALDTGLDTPAYRAAYARAESAVAGQRVPPRLRSYVRDYFVAIRPQADR